MGFLTYIIVGLYCKLIYCCCCLYVHKIICYPHDQDEIISNNGRKKIDNGILLEMCEKTVKWVSDKWK